MILKPGTYDDGYPLSFRDDVLANQDKSWWELWKAHGRRVGLQALKRSRHTPTNSLQIASVLGWHRAVAHLLTKTRADPTAYGNIALRWAAEKGHLAVVNRLLEDGRIDPSAKDNSPLWWAADKGHLEIVSRLLEDGRVNPAASDNYALRCAARKGHLEIVNLLLEDTRVDPTAKDNEAHRWATENGHVEIVLAIDAAVVAARAEHP